MNMTLLTGMMLVAAAVLFPLVLKWVVSDYRPWWKAPADPDARPQTGKETE